MTVEKHDFGYHVWHFHKETATIHREDGPAMLTPNSQEWVKHNKYHREDGPARMFKINSEGDHFHCEWWFNGVLQHRALLSEQAFNQYWAQE